MIQRRNVYHSTTAYCALSHKALPQRKVESRKKTKNVIVLYNSILCTFSRQQASYVSVEKLIKEFIKKKIKEIK